MAPMQTTATDLNRKAFTEAVSAALDGKEGYLLTQDATTGGVKVIGAVTDPIVGAMVGRLKPAAAGDNPISVRLLGKNGTVVLIQSGAIDPGARVKADSGALGKVCTEGTGARTTLGIKIWPLTAGAAGDFIEVLDRVEYYAS